MSTFAGLTVRNTSTLFTPDTRLCVLCYAPTKYGKTTLCATLDELTKKHLGKPTLGIAVEAGEGGGTASIEAAGVDFITPTNFNEFNAVIASLASDTTYGGVFLDSASEYVKRFLQPYALKFPTKGAPPATRVTGVPARDDYQTMGEQARIHFNQLINLTTHPNLNIRKHLLVTALSKEKTDDNNTITAIQPDLPGAMSASASAMFQTVCTIKIKSMVEKSPEGKPIRRTARVLSTEGDGIRVCGDRTHRFPPECEPNLCKIWEEYWIPSFTKPTPG